MTNLTTETLRRGGGLGSHEIACDQTIRASGWMARFLSASSRLRREFRAKVLKALLHLTATGFTVLREIFDESAYDRFLLRTGQRRSVVSYRAFRRDRETLLARKPRCC